MNVKVALVILLLSCICRGQNADDGNAESTRSPLGTDEPPSNDDKHDTEDGIEDGPIVGDTDQVTEKQVTEQQFSEDQAAKNQDTEEEVSEQHGTEQSGTEEQATEHKATEQAVTGHTTEKEATEPQNQGLNSCQTYTLFMMGIIPLLIAIPGLAGNAICMLVFWEERMKSATNSLLLALSVADTGLLLTWPVISMAQTVYYNVHHSLLTNHFLRTFPYMRKYFWGLANICQLTGAWLMVVITAQRYIAVCHPHKMRFLGQPRVAWIIIGVIITITLAFMAPRFLELDVWEENGQIRMADSALALNADYRMYYKLIGHYTLIFIIPVSLLIYCTVQLIRNLRKSAGKVKNQSKKDDRKAKTDDITFALIVVDIVFIICQTMNPLRRLMDLSFAFRNCATVYAYFRPLSPLLTTFNAAINFVIFVLCGKGFRTKVMQRACGRGAQVAPTSVGETTNKTAVQSTTNN